MIFRHEWLLLGRQPAYSCGIAAGMWQYEHKIKHLFLLFEIEPCIICNSLFAATHLD
jgi:hypothetical protein